MFQDPPISFSPFHWHLHVLAFDKSRFLRRSRISEQPSEIVWQTSLRRSRALISRAKVIFVTSKTNPFYSMATWQLDTNFSTGQSFCGRTTERFQTKLWFTISASCVQIGTAILEHNFWCFNFMHSSKCPLCTEFLRSCRQDCDWVNSVGRNVPFRLQCEQRSSVRLKSHQDQADSRCAQHLLSDHRTLLRGQEQTLTVSPTAKCASDDGVHGGTSSIPLSFFKLTTGFSYQCAWITMRHKRLHGLLDAPAVCGLPCSWPADGINRFSLFCGAVQSLQDLDCDLLLVVGDFGLAQIPYKFFSWTSVLPVKCWQEGELNLCCCRQTKSELCLIITKKTALLQYQTFLCMEAVLQIKAYCKEQIREEKPSEMWDK